MKTNILAILAAALAFGTSAYAQAPLTKCDKVEKVAPMDAGWKTVGIRRPKIDATFTTMSVQIYGLPVDQVRMDTGDDAKVIRVDKCPQSVGMEVKVVRDGDWDETEIPIPSTAKDLIFKSCSAATRTCWTAKFNGDFDSWIVLSPATDTPSGPVKITGKYK